MDPTLDTWQKKALSECVGEIILEFYSGDPPLWAQVKTDDLAVLRSSVVQRLRCKGSNDVADALESAKDSTTRAIHQRFKSLREKKRRELQKREAEKQASLQGTGAAREVLPAHTHLAKQASKSLHNIEDLCLSNDFRGAVISVFNSLTMVEGPRPHDAFLGMDAELITTIQKILPKLYGKTLKALDPYETRFLVDLLNCTMPAPAIPVKPSELLHEENFLRRRDIIIKSLNYVPPTQFVFCLSLFSQDLYHPHQKQVYRVMVHEVVERSQWPGGPMRYRAIISNRGISRLIELCTLLVYSTLPRQWPMLYTHWSIEWASP
ncbi:MAG: hypothetical protein Q9173_001899 [Seirophora scorigena]